MKRDIITAADIKTARKAGLTALSIAPDAIITPQAKDDAREWKIQLVREERPPAGGMSGSHNFVAPAKEKENNLMSSDIPARQTPGNFAASFPFTLPALANQTGKPAAIAPQPVAKPATPHNASGTAGTDTLREAVLQQVYARLAPGTRPNPLLEQLIDKAMQDATASASSNCAGCCHSCMSGTANAPQEQAALSSNATPQPGRTEAGGVVAIDHRTLPWERFDGATQGVVNIVDVITSKDGSPMGGGYLEWNATSFPWTLTYAEIDVVLEGELHITSGGRTVVGRPGDMLYIPKDTDVIFSSPGYVKFAYATWPADWSNQGGS